MLLVVIEGYSIVNCVTTKKSIQTVTNDKRPHRQRLVSPVTCLFYSSKRCARKTPGRRHKYCRIDFETDQSSLFFIFLELFFTLLSIRPKKREKERHRICLHYVQPIYIYTRGDQLFESRNIFHCWINFSF